MRILMMTNTYLPHVGGVARSVETFTEQYRRQGHQVLIVAPMFPDMPTDETDVVRVPALQRFNGSDFSVRLPIPGFLHDALSDFNPDIVHSHHPFLLGDTAQRVAAMLDIPLVFTHHTMYERYTHYVPGDSPGLRRFVIDLATHYANLCDHVIAPSESIAAVLGQRGVDTPIEAIPTGVDIERFAQGNGQRVRADASIPDDAFVVGHVGRLAPEKNLPLLAKAVSSFLRRDPRAYFLLAGKGPSAQDIEELFRAEGIHDRLVMTGTLEGQALVDVYHAMDVFAFASTSETQGMVLTEAMAAGVPVVAVDAPGAREVVADGANGRLLPSQDAQALAEALQWVAAAHSRDQLIEAARDTANRFSQEVCAKKALDLYQSLIESELQSGARREVTPWESVLRLIEVEYHLWENRAAAASTMVQGEFLTKMPLLRWLRHYSRRLRRVLSRNEWTTRLLNLPSSVGTEVETGLVMIQIDGLSRRQLERAIRHGRLPFLRRLIHREAYHTHTLYSGLPSSTPAVQGELFYGVRNAVPAFGFRDRQTGHSVRMYEQPVAAKVQQRLGATGQGLLEGGSSYCNIYSGGAEEARFCAATFGWGDFFRAANPFSLFMFVLLNLMTALRILGLMAIELGLSVVDFFRGIIAGHNLMKELKFIPTRVGICVLLRELVTIGASVDATRGLPIVHVNLLGYDEQAHRRGPTSAFAHWTLKGVDHAIRRIWDAAHRSRNRDYVFWVYSDHGQEEVVPYSELAGKPIEQAVAEVLAADPHVAGDEPEEHLDTAPATEGVEHTRTLWLGEGILKRLFGKRWLDQREAKPAAQQMHVTAVGPLGHVYLPEEMQQQGTALLDRLAQQLTGQARVPSVMFADGEETIAWTAEGQLRLPQDADRLLGTSHPFLESAARDLVDLCRHPDSGQLVLLGWKAGQPAVSFPHERGAHGGPGSEETRAFALLPPEVPVDPRQPYLRPVDLRRLALDTLHEPRPHGRVPVPALQVDVRATAAEAPVVSNGGQENEPLRLRILTYNVHSCIGMDGKLSPKRVARVIARCRPDIVALQEVDVGRRQSGEMDQAELIAHQLEMEHHFHAAWQVEEEKYGNAVLSRFPMECVKAGVLPAGNRRRAEPRGAIWVRCRIGPQTIHLINTHLGLSPREREAQIDALVGDDWLGACDDQVPCIVCGDFNMRPNSAAYQTICQRLKDAQVAVDDHRPRPTWSSAYPWRRIDHVFISHHFDAVVADIRQSQLARIASDHLPLAMELQLTETVLAGAAVIEADLAD